MSSRVRVGLVLFAAIAAFVCTAAQAQSLSSASAPQYRPPADHLAPRRIGGPSRGTAPLLPGIAVLAPDHLGLTRSEQPRLYWFISAPTSTRVEATLIEPGRERPLMETVVSASAAGIQTLDLHQLGVRLQPGVEYEWSIALVTDPAQRSRDTVSGGAIMRIQTTGDDMDDASEYARRGLWYDALMALDRSPVARPDDAPVRQQRAALLEQAGLLDVAAFERR
jgi:hypothetical protein